MIALRRATRYDVRALKENGLHPISQSEVESVGFDLKETCTYLDWLVANGTATACDIDGVLAFIAASSPFAEKVRQTSFIAAKGAEGWKLALGARRWRKAEKAAYPGNALEATSYSRHPLRDRFFAAIGAHKVGEGPGYARFSDV